MQMTEKNNQVVILEDVGNNGTYVIKNIVL